MTITNFKNWVYGYINRSSSLFTTTEGGSVDQVLYAMNSARRAAQRTYAFELLRRDAFLATSEVGANWQTGAKSTPGGATAVLMRRIDSVWNYSATSVTAGTIYPRTSRIRFLPNPGEFKNDVSVDPGALSLDTATSSVLARPKFAYLNGSTLCITTVSTSTNVLINGISFLDDLAGSEDPDIFLTYFTDWFFWATLIQLNQFLKDDQRVPIDLSFVERLWLTVKQMDGDIANSGDMAMME